MSGDGDLHKGSGRLESGEEVEEAIGAFEWENLEVLPELMGTLNALLVGDEVDGFKNGLVEIMRMGVEKTVGSKKCGRNSTLLIYFVVQEPLSRNHRYIEKGGNIRQDDC